MSSPWFIAAERARLEKSLPQGVRLRWLLGQQAYQLIVKLEGESKARILREIPRSEIQKWTNKDSVIDYVARRSLYEAGLPVEMRRS